jgi:hypothetical protein
MALAGTNAFAEFCLVLEQFVLTGGDELVLATVTLAIAIEAKRRVLPPERVLHALRLANCAVTAAPRDTRGRYVDERYHHAVRLFLRSYFFL